MASSKDDSIPSHRGTVPPNVLCLSPKLCHCKRPTIIQNSFRTHSKFAVFHSCRGYWKNNARNCNFFEWVGDEDVAIGVGNISMREAKESAIASKEN
uniref:Zinc finger GRF-type domain-containing protein n=1 Tax=Kalanchoe fedtschenkoi TaxID=63787 RepID=A0A7N0T449_KALFE